MEISNFNFDKDKNAIDKGCKKIEKSPTPEFSRYQQPLSYIKKTLKPYLKYKNIILIGHGGSITSTQGFDKALNVGKKKLVIIDTPEPDFLADVKKNYKKNDSLVVVVSKSGTNVDVLEIMLYFLSYNMLVVTNPEGGALLEMAIKLGIQTIDHPAIGGRYSAFTASSMVPSYLLGINIDKLIEGADYMYSQCSPKVKIKQNLALMIAMDLYLQEKKGYTEVYMPVYSKKLEGFSNLIVQLIHESSGKEGVGQTFFAATAPEAQHHTNQRVFGGRKNVCTCFIRTDPSVQKNDTRVSVPKKLQNISLRHGTLKDIDNNLYSNALQFEFDGVFAHAKKNKIPRIDMVLEKCDEFEIGSFVALWHYVAVYSSILRNVNPFDQPEVEYAKDISFEKRVESKN